VRVLSDFIVLSTKAILLFGCSLLAMQALASSPDKPKVIALAPHIVEMLYSIGAEQQILATSEFSDYPEAAKQLPRVGNYLRLQLESIVSLQPDYIFAWRNGSPADDLAKLEQLGYQVVYSEPKTFTDIADEIQLFATLTGHEPQGRQLAQTFNSKLQQITARFHHKSKLLGFYELWHQPLTTIAMHSWPQQHLDICGVTNPFITLPTAYPQVSIEQAVSQPLQLIIQPLSVNQQDKIGFNWQQWPALPAIKHQQIIKPDADKMHRMTLRALDELTTLCEKIDEVRQFYQQQI
jgi:vitamin B12 transport system substrate-binding protein